jgi:phage shock protein A
MNERTTQIQQSAARAAKLSSDAVSAMRAGDFNLSRTLLKDAVEAGRKCQGLIKENENPLKSSD